MQSFSQPGDVITAPAPYDRLSGEAALIGSLVCVAAGTVLNTVSAEWKTSGVFSLAKATGETWAIGDALYWNNTNKNFTKTATGAYRAGAALSVQASGDTKGMVRLNGVCIPATGA